MKKILYDRQKMINLLIATSILMFCSLVVGVAIGVAPIAGVGFTLWVTTVFWNVRLMLYSNNMNVGTIVSEIDKKYDTAKVNKKFGEQLLYGITIPMMAIGLIMIAIIITMFFTVL